MSTQIIQVKSKKRWMIKFANKENLQIDLLQQIKPEEANSDVSRRYSLLRDLPFNKAPNIKPELVGRIRRPTNSLKSGMLLYLFACPL